MGPQKSPQRQNHQGVDGSLCALCALAANSFFLGASGSQKYQAHPAGKDLGIWIEGE
jgi:hypothetical protein